MAMFLKPSYLRRMHDDGEDTPLFSVGLCPLNIDYGDDSMENDSVADFSIQTKPNPSDFGDQVPTKPVYSGFDIT
jgi:hypothetical protein